MKHTARSIFKLLTLYKHMYIHVHVNQTSVAIVTCRKYFEVLLDQPLVL